jgi:hypothetical protein
LPDDKVRVVTGPISSSLHAVGIFTYQLRWYIAGILCISLVYLFWAQSLRIYVCVLRFLLSPVVGGTGLSTGTSPGDSPFEIKLGELEFILPNGTPYRGGDFAFATPFDEEPHVFIAESTGGNWLLVKIDAKGKQGFRWAVQRATGQPGDYPVHLQWIAIAPRRSKDSPGGGQLVIHSAKYGYDG